ncbi:TPA: hypothetical protein EYP75_06550, partial [Candidatus Bathyarchaeota archaeon]|nr:hypothetical protein [Candidatus Bathyarchaeota archaeon]
MKHSSDPKLISERGTESFCYAILYLVALFGSTPFFSSPPIPPGFDSAMHLSKIRIFSQYFPYIPRWFPWWYCGTPSLRFYPPLSYLTATSLGWLFQTSPVETYKYTDLFFFFFAGLFTYLFMKAVGNNRFSSLISAVFYMLSPQTLYGRFFIGHFTHNFSMFLIPLTFFCIVKYGGNIKKTALITAPLFAMLFLSHLQTALSFGFMLGIYFLFKMLIGGRMERPEHRHVHLLGLILGGALGIYLASFWLLPSLLEGLGRLGLTGEAALQTVIPIESLFVDAEHLWYLSSIQRIWNKQYFLGFPLILFFSLAIVLIIKRKLTVEKTFWGIIFTSWVAFFLFGIVSPRVGLILGWPNRLPHFVSMPMAMLAGLAVDWIEGR